MAKYSCSVSSGYNYKVRCRALKGNVRSGWTDYSSNVSTKPNKPEGITEIKAISETSISLSWTEATTAESYDIEYATQLDFLGASNASTIVNNITTTRYIITGLSTGEKYFARVRSVNDKGNSDWTEASSIILGAEPAAPTTWSSSSTIVVGENARLCWMHNSKDGSKETKAEVKCIINNGNEVVNEVRKNNTDDVSYYDLRTNSYTEGATVRWSVRTAGITNTYGPWSTTRLITAYAPPSLSLSITDGESGNGSTTSITKYPFYITLDSTDGLILGQHVYIEPDYGQTAAKEGIWLDESYIVTDDGDPYVWAADSKMKLEKRKVTLVEHDDEQFQYEITSGLTEDDSITWPMDGLYEGVTAVTDESEVDYSSPLYNTQGTEDMDEGYLGDGSETYDMEEHMQDTEAGNWDEAGSSDKAGMQPVVDGEPEVGQ